MNQTDNRLIRYLPKENLYIHGHFNDEKEYIWLNISDSEKTTFETSEQNGISIRVDKKIVHVFMRSIPRPDWRLPLVNHLSTRFFKKLDDYYTIHLYVYNSSDASIWLKLGLKPTSEFLQKQIEANADIGLCTFVFKPTAFKEKSIDDEMKA